MLKRKLISLTLCAMMLFSSCIILTSSAQAYVPSGWGQPIMLEEGKDGTNAYDQQVAMNNHGDAIAVWCWNGGDVHAICANILTAGTWSGPEAIAVLEDEAFTPQIAMNDANEAVVVWKQYDGWNYYVIRAMTYSEGVWSAPVTLSDPGYDANEAQVAMNPAGDAIAVWQQEEADGFHKIYSSFFSDGMWSESIIISSNGLGLDATMPRVAITTDGRAMAVWGEYVSLMSSLVTRTWDGVAWENTAQTITSGLGTIFLPSIAMDSFGNAVIAWTQVTGMSLHEVRVATYIFGEWSGTQSIASGFTSTYGAKVAMGENGNIVLAYDDVLDPGAIVHALVFEEWDFSDPDIFSSGTFTLSPNQDVAMDANGNAMVVWADYDETVGEGSISAVSWAGDGWNTPVELYNDYNEAQQPALAMSGDGDAVVAWCEYGTGTKVLAKTYSEGVWSGTQDLSTDVSSNGVPQVAMNQDGDAVVVWQHIDNEAIIIRAMTYSEGVWGSMTTLSEATAHAGKPVVAINSQGDAVVAWVQVAGSQLAIMAAFLDDGIWADPEVIHTSSYVSITPLIAMGGDEAVIAWYEPNGEETDIVAAIFADGDWSLSTIVEDTAETGVLDLAMSANGDIIAVWQESGTGVIHAAMFTDGSWSNSAISSPTEDIFEPQVAMDADGNAIVTWIRYDGMAYLVEAVLFSDGTWGSPTALSGGADFANDVTVAMNSRGDAIVGWKNSSTDVVEAAILSDGAWSEAEVISDPSDNMPVLRVCMSDNGMAMALWIAVDGGSKAPGMYGKSGGSYVIQSNVHSYRAWGGVETIFSDGRIDNVDVAMDGSGRALATWDMQPLNKDYSSVYAAVYSPDNEPSVTITAPSDGYLNDTGSVVIEWTGANVDHYTVSVDDLVAVDVGVINRMTIDDLADGEHKVNVTAYNNMGESTYSLVNFVVDTVWPTINITHPAIGAWYNTSSMNVTWTVSDAGSGLANVSVSMDNGAWIDVTTDYHVFDSLADGHHNVSVRAYDHAGNYRIVYRLFNIETRLPVLDITDPENDALINSSSVELVWEGVSSAPIGRYWLSVDGGEFFDVGLNTSYVLSGLEQGAHTVTLRARDFAGNYNTTSVQFTVDSIAPVVDITAPADGIHTKERNITVEWTVTESGTGLSSVEISVDGGEWTAVTESSYELLNLTDGTHTVAIRVTDNSGNVGEASVSFVVDNEGPTATISPSGDDVSIGTVITVTFSEAMNETSVIIAVSGVEGTVSWNGNIARFTPSSALAYDTTYTVTVSGEDLAGNNVTAESSFTTLKNECKIFGTVKDADGNAVANATVTLSNGMTTTTNVAGYFEFLGVPSGSYTLNVTKDGFTMLSQTVNATAGQATDLHTLNLAVDRGHRRRGGGRRPRPGVRALPQEEVSGKEAGRPPLPNPIFFPSDS